MPSPFPGMDPYFEPRWQGVHAVLVAESWRQLNRTLPAGLVASVEDRVTVRSDVDGPAVGRIGPDLRVFDPSPTAAEPATVVIDAPFTLIRPAEPPVERYVGIFDDEGRLVTVVEFVSPANKRRPGITRFRRNRADLLAGGVGVVEVDLVRAGNWQALMLPDRCPVAGVSTYRVVVRTAGPEGEPYLFPIHLRDALPDVPIPLRAADQPATLSLGNVVATVYEDGRYGTRLDYRRPLRPAMDAGDAAWVASVVGGLNSRRTGHAE